MSSRGRAPNNSTSMSLHERFSKLRSSAGGQRLTGKVQGARKNTALLQKTASKSNRLAQQMERRNSALSAALKIKKKSIKQRLGMKTTVSTGAKFRGAITQSQRKLGGPNRGAKTAIRGGRKQTLVTKSPAKIQGGRGGQVRGNIRGGRRAGRNNRPPITKVNTQPSTPSKSPNRGRGGKSPKIVNTPNSRGQIQRGRGKGQQRGGRNRGNAPNVPNRAQPTRGGNSRGRGGRGGGRGGKPVKLSKEDLDNQLEQYMSKTRNALDKDLEHYMSKIGTDVEMS